MSAYTAQEIHRKGHGQSVDAGVGFSPNSENENFQLVTPPGLEDRSQSLGSLLDYGGPSRWLRGLWKYPGLYTSKLTGAPDHNRPFTVSDTRRPSEPLPNKAFTRSQTGKSTVSGKSGCTADSFGVKRAVKDFERLLGEALTLATQVIERSENSSRAECKHCHEGPNKGTPTSSDEVFASAHESLEHLSKVNLNEHLDSGRSGHKHAATHCEYPTHIPLSATGGYRYDASRAFQVPCRNPSKQNPVGIDSEVPEEDMTSCATEVVDFEVGKENRRANGPTPKERASQPASGAVRNTGEKTLPDRDLAGGRMHIEQGISLRRRSHVSLRNAQGFSLVKSRKRQPIARDWSPVRKRFAASVACLSTALVGMLLGIYAGLVPSIQYYILDQSHSIIHGNTGCFLGMALPTFFLWPLPLLHGRKPYIIASLSFAMPLLFPQALSVNSQRFTHLGSWRALLLISRSLMGLALGFSSMNFHAILTDLFGASLMSHNPHQEVVDVFDSRRHGGGMGVWLGIWTWCWVGSLGMGFFVGAAIIDHYPPVWGFYVSIFLIAIVLFLNIVCPEVRRSAFRRSVTEVRTGTDISRRLARGEVMMHRVKTGPKWWGEEVYHGLLLSLEMLRQPGFIIMAVYVSWIYAQIVLVIVLLGALSSRIYRFHATYVGLLVAGVSLGSLLAIPFQKANVFSRSRHIQIDSSRETLENKVTWSSHLVRRVLFTVLLPVAAGCYAAVSSGPPLSIGVPTFFAICIGFLSCLAISECNGVIMETFDTSDLTPGMTGRPRGDSGEKQKRTNYSSFPRISAGFAIIHTLAFTFAAGATALGGQVTRTLGQQVATAIVAGILLVLSLLLLLVLVRFKNVLIVPSTKSEEMDRVVEERRKSTQRRRSMPNNPQAINEEANAWRPFMIGNPVCKKRRMNVLELGGMTRWQDIRRKNKLIDEGIHVNRAAMNQGLEALEAQGLFRMGSGRGRRAHKVHRSDQGSSDHEPETELSHLGAPTSAPPQPHQLVERECFMGQTVKEETEEDGQMDSKLQGGRTSSA